MLVLKGVSVGVASAKDVPVRGALPRYDHTVIWVGEGDTDP